MMDGSEKMESDDVVIIVENEAESKRADEAQGSVRMTVMALMDVCPVCKLSFSSREPKLLPCLHSFCKRCLPSHNTPSSGASNAQQMNMIRCPVCQQECMDVEVLDNFFVKDSVEVPSSTMEKSCQLCMSCDDNTEASGFCVECAEFLCVTCIDAHQRVKFTRDHTVRQITEMSSEAMGASTQKPVFCDIHRQEPLKLFCETCDLLTCRDCQLLKHKDHNYQFLEDAYKNHKEHLENMTCQLQEKKKVIEDISNTINNGLQQVDENRKTVTNEIKKSICNLIMEINRKGKLLFSQLETITKDHETLLKKQQQDVTSLSTHLDHVINFTKWATASNSGTALLYCKRLITCQIHYLMRAKCSISYVPQSLVRFQSRSAFWASNVDLGSLMVEKTPVRHPSGPQPFPFQQMNPGARPDGLQTGFPNSHSQQQQQQQQQRQSTLAQLQMQVEKLSQHANRHQTPNQWSWYHGMRLPGPSPHRPMQGGSPSQALPSMPQHGRRYGARSPPPMLQPTNLTPQTLRGLINNPTYPLKPMEVHPRSRYPHSAAFSSGASLPTPQTLNQNMQVTSYLNRRFDPSMQPSAQRPSYQPSHLSTPTERTVQGRQMSVTSSEPKTSSGSWKRVEAPQSGPSNPSKRRRRSSPGPVIVIKDEPEDDEVHFVNTSAKASLPDSTGVQSQTPQAEQQSEKTPEADEDPNEDWCAVCQNGGELLCCDKCPKVFHLSCHIPTLTASPSGEWYCTFCRDLTSPEMEYNVSASCESNNVKQDPDSEAFTPVDKRKCERLLLRLYSNELSTDFQEPVTPSSMPEYSEIIKTPMDLSVIRSKLEDSNYKSTEDFVEDVRLIFKNCATFHKEDTEMANVGANLESYFEEQLKLLYPDRTFPGVKEESVASLCPDDSSPLSKTPPQETSPAEEIMKPSSEDLPQGEPHIKDIEKKPENLSSPAGSSPADAETDSKATKDPTS
ncbi:transcription intermediary factor 1-alpha-like isoform X2 [Carassius carassius]|uniref:transcription intermediary factor 1-alpha-like isoform X2 n=1 Tax=Carassius carassius TaxID=217509 RepID=UPI0028685931|nr:transcription intermediary factor 1-alpha-like isoform X2 [Carassius carassius]